MSDMCTALQYFPPITNKEKKEKGIVPRCFEDGPFPQVHLSTLETINANASKKSNRHLANQTLVSNTRSSSISKRILVPFALRSSNQHVVLTLHTSSSTAHTEPHKIIAHVEAAGA